jgi:hypothetical protein
MVLGLCTQNTAQAIQHFIARQHPLEKAAFSIQWAGYQAASGCSNPIEQFRLALKEITAETTLKDNIHMQIGVNLAACGDTQAIDPIMQITHPFVKIRSLIYAAREFKDDPAEFEHFFQLAEKLLHKENLTKTNQVKLEIEWAKVAFLYPEKNQKPLKF